MRGRCWIDPETGDFRTLAGSLATDLNLILFYWDAITISSADILI